MSIHTNESVLRIDVEGICRRLCAQSRLGLQPIRRCVAGDALHNAIPNSNYNNISELMLNPIL